MIYKLLYSIVVFLKCLNVFAGDSLPQENNYIQHSEDRYDCYSNTQTLTEKPFLENFDSKTESIQKLGIIKNSKLIFVASRAGFGNQLFHYAAGYALSKRIRGGVLILVEENNSISLNTMARQKSLSKFNLDYTLRCSSIDVSSLNNPFYVTDQNILALNGDEASEYLIGFQGSFYESYKYFSQHIIDLRAMLKPLKNFEENTLKEAKRIQNFQTSVAIHIRRGDFLSENHSVFMIPINYYCSAMNLMKQKFSDAFFFIFTDSPQDIKPLFMHLQDCEIISDGSLSNIDEFFLMTTCQHLITGNSTFSSWAGFLKTQGTIIAPFQKRINLNDPRDIYPDHWITLNPFSITGL